MPQDRARPLPERVAAASAAASEGAARRTISDAALQARALPILPAFHSAELTAIESIGRRADENRRLRYAVAVGFVSAMAIPATLIVAFLGINARSARAGPCSATTTRACTLPWSRSSLSAPCSHSRCGCSSAASPASLAPPPRGRGGQSPLTNLMHNEAYLIHPRR